MPSPASLEQRRELLKKARDDNARVRAEQRQQASFGGLILGMSMYQSYDLTCCFGQHASGYSMLGLLLRYSLLVVFQTFP